jgi:hypothetical protein
MTEVTPLHQAWEGESLCLWCGLREAFWTEMMACPGHKYGDPLPAPRLPQRDDVFTLSSVLGVLAYFCHEQGIARDRMYYLSDLDAAWRKARAYITQYGPPSNDPL